MASPAEAGLDYTELHNVVDAVLKQFPGAKVVRLYGRPQDGAHHVFEIRFKGCTITVDEFGRVEQKQIA